jgi:hypothetical protein
MDKQKIFIELQEMGQKIRIPCIKLLEEHFHSNKSTTQFQGHFHPEIWVKRSQLAVHRQASPVCGQAHLLFTFM